MSQQLYPLPSRIRPAQPKRASWLRAAGACFVALLLCTALLGIYTQYTAQAQELPVLAVEPNSGGSGSIVALSGSGFSVDGATTGDVLWDGESIDTVIIGPDGTFSDLLVVPLNAAVGSHNITVCNTFPCSPDNPGGNASTPFRVVQQNGPLSGTIAYIYSNDTFAAESFFSLLTDHGFKMVVVSFEEILETDFSPFDLILIASDTGDNDLWATADAEVEHLVASEVNVLGVGEGGYEFFGRLGLEIGRPNGTPASVLGEVQAVDPALPYYRQPYNFDTISDAPFLLYRDNTDEVSIPVAELSDEVEPLGYSSVGDFAKTNATLIRQGCQQLWGFNGSAGLMGKLGHSLFINAVVDAMDAACFAPELPLRVQVCELVDDTCIPASGARVHHWIDGEAQGPPLLTDAAGFVPAESGIEIGDELWAQLPISPTRSYSSTTAAHLYLTSGVTATAVLTGSLIPEDGFDLMRLYVSEETPLWVQDLDVSAQWYVESEPDFAAWLSEQITRTSDYLYSFTDGQFALGAVTIRQNYEGWEEADLKLHVDNTLQPNADIGGVVVTDTLDLSPAITVGYSAGHIYMGSHWNRYGEPPNEPIVDDGKLVPPALMENDWAHALAHEFGHYLFFLYDTYRDPEGTSSEEIAAACTNSAMGNVYLPINHGFVADQAHWDTNCGATEAHYELRGRTEWDTIALWYPWVETPAAFVFGPEAAPARLTTVTFITPTVVPTTPLASQLFAINYVDGETSSAEAMGYIYRDDRIYNQGKPAKDANQIALTDARVGDRLCVYDINDYAESGDTPRHQFGCEIISAGDGELQMTKFVPWRPLVQLEQIGPNALSLSVKQALSPETSTPIMARVFPEHGAGLDPVALDQNGDTHTTVFSMTEPVGPVYLQLWIDDVTTGLSTRREVVADRGTGGGGAQGPAKFFHGTFVVSSDGFAEFESDEPVELKEGESIAWQSMPGTPPLSLGKSFSGQSYRLDAYPASLAENGTVRIRYVDPAQPVESAGVEDVQIQSPSIYFWNGNTWRRLTTTVSTPTTAADGVNEASARSEGVGVYVVDMGDQQFIFMPLIVEQ